MGFWPKEVRTVTVEGGGTCILGQDGFEPQVNHIGAI